MDKTYITITMKSLTCIVFLAFIVSGADSKSMLGFTLLSSKPMFENYILSSAGMNLTVHTINGSRFGFYIGYQGLPKAEDQEGKLYGDGNDSVLSIDTLTNGYRVLRTGLVFRCNQLLSVMVGPNLIYDCFIIETNMLENYRQSEYTLQSAFAKKRINLDAGLQLSKFINKKRTLAIAIMSGYNFGLNHVFAGIEIAWVIGATYTIGPEEI